MKSRLPTFKLSMHMYTEKLRSGKTGSVFMKNTFARLEVIAHNVLNVQAGHAGPGTIQAGERNNRQL